MVHIAAKHGHILTLNLLQTMYKDHSTLVFEEVVNERAGDNLTPFMRAVLSKKFVTARHLLKLGADKNAKVDDKIDLATLALQHK